MPSPTRTPVVIARAGAPMTGGASFVYANAGERTTIDPDSFYYDSTAKTLYVSGGFLGAVTGLVTPVGILTLAATTTAAASMNIPIGTAPTAPADGDLWREDNTNTGLKIRINGVTKTVTVG